MLQPGAQAPDFSLPAVGGERQVSLRECAGKRVALLFVPSRLGEALAEQLGRYQDSLALFADLNARVLAVSEGPLEPPQPALHLDILSDPARAVWSRYAGAEPAQPVRPTAILIDEDGRIRAVYEAERYPHLPGPQALARGVRKLNEVPRPAPVTGEDWGVGPLEAPVVLIEYSDYQCHHCAETAAVLRELTALYGQRLLLIHRHFPLRQAHPLAQKAAEAAEAAGAQGKFWEMHHRLFAAGGALEREHLATYASEIGLDAPRFLEELDGGRYEEAVNEDFRSAAAGGVRLPPTLFVNGILFEGARTAGALRARVDSLL